jgi:hypothetical protein
VLVETNQKHPLPTTSEDYVLKYLPRVFTASSNPHGKTDMNKAFNNELEADLRADKEYSDRWSLKGFMQVCERLIFKWQKAHYDEVVRNGKRKDTDGDADKTKKQRAGPSSAVMKAGEYCEGCGKPRHKRESCQLTAHPNYNKKGLWIHSEGMTTLSCAGMSTLEAVS